MGVQLVECQTLLCTTEWWVVRVPAGTVENITVKWSFMAFLTLHTKDVKNGTGLYCESKL